LVERQPFKLVVVGSIPTVGKVILIAHLLYKLKKEEMPFF
jgi:hypothetical protein